MKKFLSIAFLFLTACILCAAEKELPFVWKEQGSSFRDFQTYAFGFKEKSNEYCFAFQIKSLQQLMAKPNSTLVCSIDTDNNAKTGRDGCDFQLNIILDRGVVSAIVWQKSEIKSSYAFLENEFSIESEGDILYLTIRKNLYLKNVKFGNTVKLYEEHRDGGNKKIDSGLAQGKVIKLK